MCITDGHDMTLTVKLVLNLTTTITIKICGLGKGFKNDMVEL